MINLKKVFYTHQDSKMYFNFTVPTQQKIAILGASGAGKSTLLNLIAGFIYPDQGEIILNQQNLTNAPPNKRPVSMLFQDNNVFNHLTVWQNIALGMSSSLKLTTEQSLLLVKILTQVGLTDYQDRLPHQLSGGQKQRIAIARCLVQRRPILLLDEPFSSLDPTLRSEMLYLTAQICNDYQLTLLMVTHNLDDAKAISDRTLIINHGEIALDVKTQELPEDTNHFFS